MEKDPNLALFLAVVGGDTEAASEALAAGADVEWREPVSNLAPLAWAARLGRVECVELLMLSGADPWKPESEAPAAFHSPIGCAMQFGHWEAFDLMVRSCPASLSPNPERLDREWRAAVGGARLRALPALAQLGARMDARMPLLNATPVEAACRLRDEGLLRELLRLGASPDRAREAEEAGPRPPWPVAAAIAAGWGQGLKILLEAGRGVSGEEALDEMALAAGRPCRSEGGSREVLDVLLASGVDILAPAVSGRMLTAAVRLNNLEAAKWLCERGVDPEAAWMPKVKSPWAMAQASVTLPAMAALINGVALARRELAQISEAAGQGAFQAPLARRM